MRLTLSLLKWPKNRPNGSIWIGKYRMIQKVHDGHTQRMLKDVEREKKNSFYLVNPFLSKEQEASIQDKLSPDRPDRIWYQMRKTVTENTVMQPVPLSEHYQSLKGKESWE